MEQGVEKEIGLKERNTGKRFEFWFCFIVIWAASVFQGYALYQEEKMEQEIRQAFAVTESVSAMGRIGNFQKSVEKNLGEGQCLKGLREGNMSLKEREEMTKQIFRYLQAKEVESVKEEELYTVYGYSKLFTDSICYGEKQINVNLVFTYDEQRNHTLIYLGVPYVKAEY